jgi:hypothetical protein
MGVMTDNSNENDGFEAFVQREAARYNAPPSSAPRDEMWEVIAQRRAASRRDGATPLVAARPTRIRRYAPWIGMAATLALGVGIGTYMTGRRSSASELAQVPVAAHPTDSAMTTDTPPPFTEAPTPARAGDAGPRRPSTDRSAPTVRTDAANAVANEVEAPDASYSIASRQHLTRAEALIAVVAMSSEDALLDSLTGKWARDILTNTRLLLDSPAGADPVRRRLLEDLETILVQLVQKSGRVEEDKAMIDRSLQRTQLLTRLRSGASGT